MWEENREHWERLIVDSERLEFELIFLVPNPQASNAEKILAKKLAVAAKGKRRVAVLELDTNRYGVDYTSEDEISDLVFLFLRPIRWALMPTVTPDIMRLSLASFLKR